MALGIPLEDVVPMVTSNPAQMIGLTDRLGALKPGYAADVSVLSDDRGRFILRDNEDTKVVAERLLRPAFCLRAGKRFDADSADPCRKRSRRKAAPPSMCQAPVAANLCRQIRGRNGLCSIWPRATPPTTTTQPSPIAQA